jgi:hypothetical protein
VKWFALEARITPGLGGKINAQVWLSAFGIEERKLDAFQQQWSPRRCEILS